MSGHFYNPKPPSYLRFTSSLILWEVNMKNEVGGKLKTQNSFYQHIHIPLAHQHIFLKRCARSCAYKKI